MALVNPNSPVIGKDIPFKGIEGEALRIIDFFPISIVENGKIKDFSKGLPYATLEVESPILSQKSSFSLSIK
jgi:hypothetical protein